MIGADLNQPYIIQPLPVELQRIVDRWDRRLDVCRLLSVADLRASLPAASMSRTTAQALLSALAHAGIHVPEPDAIERLLGP